MDIWLATRIEPLVKIQNKTKQKKNESFSSAFFSVGEERIDADTSIDWNK